MIAEKLDLLFLSLFFLSKRACMISCLHVLALHRGPTNSSQMPQNIHRVPQALLVLPNLEVLCVGYRLLLVMYDVT